MNPGGKILYNTFFSSLLILANVTLRSLMLLPANPRMNQEARRSSFDPQSIRGQNIGPFKCCRHGEYLPS